MKKVWNIISTVFVWMVVAVAVAMMVFTVISVNTFNRGDRDLFGYKAFIVLSDSMSATDFDAGDLVIVQQTDPSTLLVGDIITYVSQNEHNYGQNVTHKIRTFTTTPDGNPGFITYGTTNNIDDEAIVTYPYIQGKYIFAIPKLGNFFNFLRTPVGYILFILIPFLLLIGWQGLNCIKAFRAYKKEQMKELQREKDEIAAERRRNEQMMRQLMQMQQQMQQMQQNPGQPVPVQPEAWQPQTEEKPVRQRPVGQATAQWDFDEQPQVQQRPRAQQAPRPQPQAAPQRRTSQPQAVPQRSTQSQAMPQRSAQPQAASQSRAVQPQAAAKRSAAQASTQPVPQAKRPQEVHRQPPVKAPAFDLPTVDHTDEDDLIAELSALCGRANNAD